MVARGKKKSTKTQGKSTQKKQNEDFDLEAMEQMLANDDDHSDDNNNNNSDDNPNDSLEEDFMDNEDDESIDQNDDMYDEENGSEEEQEGYDDEEDTEDTDESEVMFSNESSNDNIVQGEEKCSLDLRNLLAMNSHQVNHRLLYKKESSNNEDDKTTIFTKGMMKANEEYLLQKASEGCSQILAGLWSLDKEKSEAGPMAILPTYFQLVTPRELVSS